MARRSAQLGLGLAACVVMSGCVKELEEEQSRVGTLLRDCVVPLPQGVTSLGAPVALEYPGESLWIWQSITLEDGSSIANVGAHARNAAEVCARGPTLLTSPGGEPMNLLPLSEEELTANDQRDDGRRFALVPVGGFVHEGTGHLYFEHVLYGPGTFDAERLGTGICLLENDSACTRVTVDGSSVLFPANARPLNQGGLIDGDQALVFGCEHTASFSDPCTLAGVPLDAITDPRAYRYFNAFNGWVERREDASVLLDQPGPLSVSAFDGRYIAVTLDIFSTRFALRFADKPTSGFGHAIQLFRGVPPDGLFPSGGREHAGLRREPKTLHFTYFTDHAAAYGLHLASFELFGGLE